MGAILNTDGVNFQDETDLPLASKSPLEMRLILSYMSTKGIRNSGGKLKLKVKTNLRALRIGRGLSGCYYNNALCIYGEIIDIRSIGPRCCRPYNNVS